MDKGSKKIGWYIIGAAAALAAFAIVVPGAALIGLCLWAIPHLLDEHRNGKNSFLRRVWRDELKPSLLLVKEDILSRVRPLRQDAPPAGEYPVINFSPSATGDAATNRDAFIRVAESAIAFSKDANETIHLKFNNASLFLVNKDTRVSDIAAKYDQLTLVKNNKA